MTKKHSIKQLPKDLEELAKRLNTTTDDLMEDIAYSFFLETEKKWEIRGGGQSYRGIKWPELKPSTVNARGGSAYPMLIDSSDMHSALDVEHDSNSARIYFQSPEEKKYARHHKGSKNLPERKLLELGPEDKRDIDEIVDKWVKDILKGKR